MPETPSVFDGFAEDDLAWILDKLERRSFAAGDTLLAQGDAPNAIYLVEHGSVDVLMSDGRGAEHKLNRVGPGGSLGEMSIFSGRPVSATVRAATDVDVFVLDKTDLRRLGGMYPRLYENIGSMLSARLVEADRRHLADDRVRVALVEDDGGPPSGAYALAASIAWHTGEPTLLVLGPGATRDERLAACPSPNGELEPRAYVLDAGDDAVTAALARHTAFKHVLVLQHGSAPQLHAEHSLKLDTLAVPLQAGDDETLDDGLLPLRTPAGRALGSTARRLADLQVGVALGSGAVRGWSHVGALQGLEAAGVPIDYIAGTSIGAVVGGGYSVGMTCDEIADALQRAAAKLFRVRLPRGGVLSPNGFRASLQGSLGDTMMDQTIVPIAVSAVDIVTQREVVLREGLLWQAVLASAAIPGVFPPQRIDGQVLVDGGVLNPVPSNVVGDMGASIQIGVRLTRRTGARMRTPHKPRLIDLFTNTFELMQSKISTEAAAASTLVIEPSFENWSGFGLRSFHEGRNFIPNGAAAVEEALPRIQAALPWMRRREHVVMH